MPGIRETTLTVEAIEHYRQWCTARGRSFNTVKAYSSDLKEFLKAAGMQASLPTGPMTLVYQTEYEELGMAWLNLNRATVSPKTTARRLTSLRGFAKWAGWGEVLHEYIAPTPGKTIPHPIPEGPAGLRRMIAQAKNYEQEAIIALGGFAGCRIAESLSISPSSFDVHDQTLTIRGKGDKTRTVPLSDEAWDILQPAYILAHSKSDLRLVSYKDRFARQIVTNLGIRAHLVRKVASHDLRATFATAVLDRTGNIRVAQELLGHASSTTTEVYTGVNMAAMRDAVRF